MSSSVPNTFIAQLIEVLDRKLDEKFAIFKKEITNSLDQKLSRHPITSQNTITEVFDLLNARVHKHDNKLIRVQNGIDELNSTTKELNTKAEELGNTIKEYCTLVADLSCEVKEWDILAERAATVEELSAAAATMDEDRR